LAIDSPVGALHVKKSSGKIDPWQHVYAKHSYIMGIHDHKWLIMVTLRAQPNRTFVTKVTKTRNRKGKNYFIYRVNVSSEVAEELEPGDQDYLFDQSKESKLVSPAWLERKPKDLEQASTGS